MDGRDKYGLVFAYQMQTQSCCDAATEIKVRSDSLSHGNADPRSIIHVPIDTADFHFEYPQPPFCAKY